MKGVDIKFGQVWETIKNYKISTGYSEKDECVIPKGRKIVVLNTPITGFSGFHVLPLSSKGLDKKLYPDLKQMELQKEGFAVSVSLDTFKEYFVLSSSQQIEFDYKDGEEFWKEVLAHNL